MSQFSTEIREKKAMLATLQATYQQAAADVAGNPEHARQLRPYSSFLGRLLAGFFAADDRGDAPIGAATVSEPGTLLQLSESIADVEYAIETHEHFKIWFGKWLKFHIWISFALYLLMALHIWAAIHFGLRWFEPTAESHFRSAATMTTGEFPASALPVPASSETPAVADFSSHFAALFGRYWRSEVKVHGIQTTVFDYAGITSEIGGKESHFTKTVAALQQVDVNSFNRDDYEKAFWINVYNFAAMKLAAEHYPVSSITDPKISADDPWGVPVVQIGDRRYSLKEIENVILLKKFDDPRIVFAISCAAISCPDRSSEIFASERIDEQLDAIVRRLFTNPDKGLAIDRDRKVVTLSWILKADQRLFGGNDQGTLRFVSEHAPVEAGKWLREHADKVTVQYFRHDWGLNDIALAGSGNEG